VKILVVDNYDSFTYNLVHYLEPLVERVDVLRNDQVSLSRAAGYDRIVFSPGPGIPRESPIMFHILEKLGPSKPILGICLGHQAIIEHYGGTIENLDTPLHGRRIDTMTIQDDPMFGKLDKRFGCGRYHSWAAKPVHLPKSLIATATDEQGYVMALRHRDFNIRGMQFHPESAMTADGLKILENWILHC
jgi:anthranilate synthase component 2